jgi:hypothetical protein
MKWLVWLLIPPREPLQGPLALPLGPRKRVPLPRLHYMGTSHPGIWLNLAPRPNGNLALHLGYWASRAPTFKGLLALSKRYGTDLDLLQAFGLGEVGWEKEKEEKKKKTREKKGFPT